MDKFPLLWKERSVGELTAEREALYTCCLLYTSDAADD